MCGGDTSVCWEWTGAYGSNGRPQFAHAHTTKTAYRVVYELYHGPIPPKTLIRHTCDNERCCNPTHLILGTHAQNMADMKFRARHGLPHHTVMAIRKLLHEGRTHKDIAGLYGVHPATISRIELGKAYAHVTAETTAAIEAKRLELDKDIKQSMEVSDESGT